MDSALLISDKIELMMNTLGKHNSLFCSDKKSSPEKYSSLESFFTNNLSLKYLRQPWLV